jgi:hypothetical protein
MELGTFRGSAKEAGVTLEEGILDSSIDLRFREDGALDTQAKFTFTDLSLSEPPDGPISRYLHLPAPLDVVIFLLRDEDGALEIPLNFEVGADGVSAGTIAEVAVTTLGTLIANAVASSPFRVVGTLGDLVPIGGEEEEEEEEGEQLMALSFSPGDTYLSRAERIKLQQLAEQLREQEGAAVTLRHELGRGDVDIAARRANPTIAECLELSVRLRNKRKEIAGMRDQWAAKARAVLGAGLDHEAQAAMERIRSLDLEAGLTERALDQVLELLRPGAERRASRRTRGGCIALGKARIEAVRDALLALDIPDGKGRVRTTRPRIDEIVNEGGGSVSVVLKGARKN